MKRKIFTLVCLGTVVLLGSSCTEQALHSSDRHDPVQQISPDTHFSKKTVVPPTQTSKLSEINKRLSQHLDNLKEKFQITVLSWGVGADHIMMMIRSYGDVERVIEEQEMKDIEHYLFEAIGEPFPLELTKQECCSGPGYSGEITQIDQTEQRVLVVSQTKKNGNTEDPEANWVRMTDDGIIVHGPTDLTFDQLEVGQQVTYWSVGLFLASYPGQTSAIKLEIADN